MNWREMVMGFIAYENGGCKVGGLMVCMKPRGRTKVD